MNNVKKYLGLIWIALGFYAGYFSIDSIGLPKLKSGLLGNQSDMVFAIIMLFILTPIIVGSLLTFGYFALKNEYKS